uniref:ATP-grasp domain-containing protein n=1 Tax=Candidatus Kentrum sp. TC TaxID=2126339 RepID=A0A450Y9M6_9GAMM|nr:MAG: ATP-grasp domain-containing protein [Candidatus Kentron sp. TC]
MTANMDHLYWVGPRLSDIASIPHLFHGAIVLSGKQGGHGLDTHILESVTRRRLNTNNPVNDGRINKHYIDSTKAVLKHDPAAVFLWYSAPPVEIDTEIGERSPFNVESGLYQRLSNKLSVRTELANWIDVIPTIELDGQDITIENLKGLFPGYGRFVIQSTFGSGGFGTWLVSSTTDISRVASGYGMLVSPYMDHCLPVNQHVIITDHGSVPLLPSVQFIQERDGRLLYQGCDYSLVDQLGAHLVDDISQTSERISRFVRGVGLRGVFGVDYLVTTAGELIFVEINPRFQGSTAALNASLTEQQCPSVQEMHMAAFQGRSIKPPGPLRPYSTVIFLNEDNDEIELQEERFFELGTPDHRVSEFNVDRLKLHVLTDHAGGTIHCDAGAPRHRYVVDRPVTTITENHQVHGLPAFQAQTISASGFSEEITRDDVANVAKLKFELFSLGITVDQSALGQLAGRGHGLTIRDGIAGGLELLLFDDIHVNVPFKESFSFLSPFSLHWSQNDGFSITYGKRRIVSCRVLPLPGYVGKTSSSGNAFVDIGQIFTDRLGVYPFRSCAYNARNKKACKFCEIGYQTPLAPVPIDDLSELVDECLSDRKSQIRHILVSGGVPSKQRWSYLVDSIKRIRVLTDMPIYQMLEPPEDMSRIEELKHAGVDEVGFNLELFNREIAERLMPGKGLVSLQKYVDTLKRAKELWPEFGAVRSLLIVGLEPLEDTLQGVEELADLGVMPILSPFRPVPGTELAHRVPPTGEFMYQAWDASQRICDQRGITLGPLCVACQNNTITVPVNEHYRYY